MADTPHGIVLKRHRDLESPGFNRPVRYALLTLLGAVIVLALFNVFGQRAIDVIVDISGYYAPPGVGGLYYHPLSKPIRLLDTRAGQGNCDSVSASISCRLSNLRGRPRVGESPVGDNDKACTLAMIGLLK